MLLKLASLRPEEHLHAVISVGVTVRYMQCATLEEIEGRLAGCSALRNEDRMALLEACHVHVHRQASGIDESVKRILKGGETETLAAALAACALADDDERFVAVARAVRGGADAPIPGVESVPWHGPLPEGQRAFTYSAAKPLEETSTTSDDVVGDSESTVCDVSDRERSERWKAIVGYQM